MKLIELELPALLKSRRKLLGLSQVGLAHASRVSLPTIQNLEAGKGNPSLQVLSPLFQALGLKLEVQSEKVDWDLLSALGLPLSSQTEAKLPTFQTPRDQQLVRLVKLAVLEVQEDKACDERKVESLQALILAIQSHYPKYFGTNFKDSVVEDFVPTELTGRLIKLKRNALAAIGEYL